MIKRLAKWLMPIGAEQACALPKHPQQGPSARQLRRNGKGTSAGIGHW
mgnify:CR=1 FL=1|jgi:hypothetical protein